MMYVENKLNRPAAFFWSTDAPSAQNSALNVGAQKVYFLDE